MLAKLPELAKSVAEIIARNADKLKTIPDFLNNGTLDAPGDFLRLEKRTLRHGVFSGSIVMMFGRAIMKLIRTI